LADIVFRKGGCHPQSFMKPAFDMARPVIIDDLRKGLHSLASLRDVGKMVSLFNNIVRDGALYALDYARVVVPVDTGRLKASLNVQQRGSMDWKMCTDVPYAVFQEYGTGVYNVGGPNNTVTKIVIIG